MNGDRADSGAAHERQSGIPAARTRRAGGALCVGAPLDRSRRRGPRPGGVAAASKDFLLDLVVQMIRKHDKIKQKRRNRACPKMNSILFSQTIFFLK